MNIVEKTYNWAYGLTPRKITTHCIIHHPAAQFATVEQIHDSHIARNFAGIGYHYYVRKDGTVFSGRPETMIGGHTSGMNYCSIGVCFEGNFEIDEMPDAQINAGWELLADIQARYPGIIVGRHKDYNATACPGKNFPFAMITEPHAEAANANEPYEWAAQAWEWAKANGIMDGTNPHEPFTREMAATVLMRFANKHGIR